MHVGSGTHGVQATGGLTCSAAGHCAHSEQGKMKHRSLSQTVNVYRARVLFITIARKHGSMARKLQELTEISSLNSREFGAKFTRNSYFTATCQHTCESAVDVDFVRISWQTRGVVAQADVALADPAGQGKSPKRPPLQVQRNPPCTPTLLIGCNSSSSSNLSSGTRPNRSWKPCGGS